MCIRDSRKTPLNDATTRFNEHREGQVSKRTVQRALCQEGYNRRVVKKKSQFTRGEQEETSKMGPRKFSFDSSRSVGLSYIFGRKSGDGWKQ